MTDPFRTKESAFCDYAEQIMAAHRARGIAVAVVDRRGTAYQKFFGSRDAARRRWCISDSFSSLYHSRS